MGGIGPVEAALTHDAVVHGFLRMGTRVELTPKAYALLVALTRTPGRLVSKQELLNEVWPGVVVGEAVLKVVVNEIRNALDDDAKSPRFVATEHRRGYRFVGSCAAGGDAVDPRRSAPAGRADALRFRSSSSPARRASARPRCSTRSSRRCRPVSRRASAAASASRPTARTSRTRRSSRRSRASPAVRRATRWSRRSAASRRPGCCSSRR